VHYAYLVSGVFHGVLGPGRQAAVWRAGWEGSGFPAQQPVFAVTGVLSAIAG